MRRAPPCLLFLAVAVLLASALPTLAHADPVLALVIGNNRSAALRRPDLRYADDDAARYHELFRMLAPAEDVRLLTELDLDTSRLHPGLAAVALPPTVANVAAQAAALAARLPAGPADVYFVFAGHGDVAEGQGFLELRDGRITGADLEQLLAPFRAARVHILIDSCNSFFVIAPRRPGGRRFATPADVTSGLQGRMPNVGVFLSTSAGGEVFEWSELQSGIFSHAVRSGLLGAADADGDGRVSYHELEAFVQVAVAEVRNPQYRPSVFARGPDGHGEAALVTLGDRGRKLVIDGPRARLTVRDADELPWIDLHKAWGERVVLHLPDRLATRFAVDDRTSNDPRISDARVIARRQSPEGSPSGDLALASLSPSAPATSPRGPDEMFRLLFALPFGLDALVAFEHEQDTAPAPVYGLSEEDTRRMRTLLQETASIDRARRIGTGIGATAAGVALTGFSLYNVLGPPSTDPATGFIWKTYGWVGVVDGAVLGAIGAVVTAWPYSKGEKLLAHFEAGMAAGDNVVRTVAEVDRQLDELAATEQRRRRMGRWTMPLSAAGVLSLVALAGANDRTGNPWGIIAGSAYTGFMAYLFADSFFETPLERMARLWRQEPAASLLPPPPKLTLFPSLSPLPSGASLSLSGTF